MRSILKRLALILVALLIVGTAGFVIWAETPLGPTPQALTALQSNEAVSLSSSSEWIAFAPQHRVAKTGFIIYPGGRVDFRSYAPLAHDIAAHGFFVALVRMPLNLAVFSPDRALHVIQAHPEITTWVVGGHSLGGAMAANFARKHLDLIDGLVLWAAYPAPSDSLSDTTLAVLSISASEDGLATPEKIRQSRALLPATTRWIVLEGGNHAGFGQYGAQPGDGIATLAPEEQQRLVSAYTVEFLTSLEQRGLP